MLTEELLLTAAEGHQWRVAAWGSSSGGHYGDRRQERLGALGRWEDEYVRTTKCRRKKGVGIYSRSDATAGAKIKDGHTEVSAGTI